MSDTDRAIEDVRAEVAALVFAKHAVVLLAAWCFVWGTAVVALRTALLVPRGPLAWGLAGAIPALLLAWWLALRSRPEARAVRAMLDRHNGCGGLLMAGEAADLGDWSRRLPILETPTLRWRSGRAWGLLSLGVLFVAVGFVLPQRYVNLATSKPLDVSQQVGQLQEQIDALKEEKIVEQAQAESLEKKLDQAAADARGEDPVKTWEAMDHLEEALSKAAAEAAEDAVSKSQKLADGETLAEAMLEEETPLPGDKLAEAMAELAKLADEAKAQETALGGELPEELMKALQAGNGLTKEQLAQLKEAMKGSREQIAKSMERLQQARLIDAKTLRARKECEGEGDGEGLGMMFAQDPDLSVRDALRGGRGGTSRGRGDAEMTWRDGANEDPSKFKEQALPPSSLEALKQSKLVSVSTGAPTVDKDAGPSAGGALGATAAGGGSANRQTVLPAHQGTVKRYFEREGRGE